LYREVVSVLLKQILISVRIRKKFGGSSAESLRVSKETTRELLNGFLLDVAFDAPGEITILKRDEDVSLADDLACHKNSLLLPAR